MKNCHRLKFHRRVNAILKIAAGFIAVGLLLPAGCSHTQKVLIPPQMDLAPYRIIGVIEFSTNGEAELREYVTQNYLQAVQAAQPDVRFLELGEEELVLSKVSGGQLDFEAVKSIGRIYNVDAVMFGHLKISDPKPDVHVSSTWQSTWQSMSAGAYIEASLITKLWETDSGAMRWTNTSRGKDTVAHLSASTSGSFHFGAKDPKDTYGRIVSNLVYANTDDFRFHYEYRKVK